MAEERKDSFAETVNTAASAAHTVKGAIKAGKAISGAACCVRMANVGKVALLCCSQW